MESVATAGYTSVPSVATERWPRIVPVRFTRRARRWDWSLKGIAEQPALAHNVRVELSQYLRLEVTRYGTQGIHTCT